MEALIREAFQNIEVIGPHVVEGHYDLIGPDAAIVLPSLWEELIQPGWSVSMHMWPMQEPSSMYRPFPPGPPDNQPKGLGIPPQPGPPPKHQSKHPPGPPGYHPKGSGIPPQQGASTKHWSGPPPGPPPPG
jgi:hypothetical protein